MCSCIGIVALPPRLRRTDDSVMTERAPFHRKKRGLLARSDSSVNLGSRGRQAWRGVRRSIAERDAEPARGEHERIERIYGFERGTGGLDGQIDDPPVLPTHHPVELALGHEIDGVDAEGGSDRAVEGGRRAAALDVSEHRDQVSAPVRRAIASAITRPMPP